MAAIRRVVDGSHPPWSLRPHCCKRDLGRGLSSAGYKLMRRVPHSVKRAPPWIKYTRETYIDRRKPRNAPTVRRRDRNHHCRSARAIRPQPPNPSARPFGLRGFDRSRGQAEELPCHSMQSNAPVSLIEREEVENDETAKNLLTGVASYKC